MTKTVGGVASKYLYDQAGHQVVTLTGGINERDEIYARGRRWATNYNAAIYFNYQDWLGTVRVNTTPYGGGWTQACASLPLGDGLGCTGSPSPEHFTGKPRGAESNLDDFGARYDSSQWGRFMSPDPGPMIFLDPQSYNRYAYALDNPLRYIDQQGETPLDRINEALKLVNMAIEYRWGGHYPASGLDCSGFMYNVYVNDPDDGSVPGLRNQINAEQQAALLKQYGFFSTNASDAQVGDSIFFKDSSGHITHTGTVLDISDGVLYFADSPTSGGLRPYTRVDEFNIRKATWGNLHPAGFGRPNESTPAPVVHIPDPPTEAALYPQYIVDWFFYQFGLPPPEDNDVPIITTIIQSYAPCTPATCPGN